MEEPIYPAPGEREQPVAVDHHRDESNPRRRAPLLRVEVTTLTLRILCRRRRPRRDCWVEFGHRDLLVMSRLQGHLSLSSSVTVSVRGMIAKY